MEDDVRIEDATLKQAYTQFYGLTEPPFTLTPSPRFLYLGKAHREALALLSYGVAERKGFILLTGEAGTGKTTMVHALLSNLDESIHVLHLANPLLSIGEFLGLLAFYAFKKRVRFKSKAHFLVAFEQFLSQCFRLGKTVILIIDEAQNLSFELLEEIRLLSNMELADEKLITIFLVGQPELTEKLRDPRCVSLNQRINYRYQIPTLDLKETEGYVSTRLRIAGVHHTSDMFPENTIRAIHRYSRGYPRLINILSENALILGYIREKKSITVPIIAKAFEVMDMPSTLLERARRRLEAYEFPKWVQHPLIRYGTWPAVTCFLIMLLAFGMTQRGGEHPAPQPVSRRISSTELSGARVTMKIEKPPQTEASAVDSQIKKELPARVAREQRGAEPNSEKESKERWQLLYERYKELSSRLTVEQGVICRGVSYRKPVGIGDSFPASVGKVYCFTRIDGAQSPARITHAWYFRDTAMARVTLKVNSSRSSVYSSMTIKPGAVGEWYVEVLGPEKEVLETVGFTITD